jgi:TolB-like protein/DNA-binding winged helix-turn-helix (wHTH) protein/Tfp pilus assembly protein PilF
VGEFTAREFHFADFTLDQSRYRLQRGERLLRLEKLPMELLILLVERRGELVSREEIAGHLWGKNVFLGVDPSINTAISKVRIALRDDPEKPRFVETVVGKGYRFAAPVICGNGDSDLHAQALPPPVPLATVPAALSSEKKSISIRLKFLLAALAVLALFGFVGWRSRGGAKGAQQSNIRSLAVLPLKNLSGDPAQEYFADGMTEALIGRLSSIRNLRVVSRTSVMGFKDSRMSAPEVAKTLHVDALVEGSVIRDRGRVRVTAQLIHGASDEHFWSETFDRDLGDTLALQSEVAQSIAQRVEVTMSGEERARLVAARPVSPEVYESYLKGQFAGDYSRAGVEKSIAYFEDAIKKDPSFAPAYLGLADEYDQYSTPGIGGAPPTEMRPKVIRAVQKALELDPSFPAAHAVMADLHREQWQWSDAEREYKLALELNPNDAGAHLAFAGWLLSQGRTEEAQAWSRRARELDPLGVTGNTIGWILFQSRHYEEAIRELRSDLAVHPDDGSTYWFLGYALIANGQPDEAIRVLEKALALSRRSPGVMGVAVRAYAHAGRRREALGLLHELKRRQQKGYVPAAAFVNAYLGLGDNEQALVWLERAFQEQSMIMQFMKVHPFFDPLREDSRFKDLLHRVGLE